MAQNVFSIDGIYYDVIIPAKGLKRSFAVLDADSTTRLADGEMDRSIIGTFYNYELSFDTTPLTKTAYDELYEKISSPVKSHVLVVPYGQTTYTFDAYITEGEDVLDEINQGGNHWSGLKVKFIAMKPART